CAVPFGAHPQPLVAPRNLDVPSYADDFDAYELFREIALDDEGHAPLIKNVLLSRSDTAYAEHFDLHARAPTMATSKPAPELRIAFSTTLSAPSERLVILAARRIAAVVRRKRLNVILAGVGHAFFAARLASLLLERDGMRVDVAVETGMFELDCG